MSDPTCGCCREPSLPAEIANRPALDAIAYRCGTFATFRAAMLRELGDSPTLKGLLARGRGDYTIALIELWAGIADVLTFYQERIANEVYLRTATERDSVLRLAELVGYRLRPGVSATALLAFTVETGKRVPLPAGLKVQSKPAAGAKPQKYETSQPLVADARLNRLPVLPAPFPRPALEQDSTGAWLQPGEEQLALAAGLDVGQLIAVYQVGPPHAMTVVTVRAVEREGEMVRLLWREPLPGGLTDGVARRTGPALGLFGRGAPETFMAMYVFDPVTGQTTWGSFVTDFSIAASTRVALDGVVETVRAGARLLVAETDQNGALIGLTDPRVLSVSTGPAAPLQGTLTSNNLVTAAAPLSGTVTFLTLDQPLAVTDLRRVVIHSIQEPPLRFWNYDLPNVLGAPEVYVVGRRAGWSTVEIGRTATGAEYGPGELLETGTIESGRPVLVLDDRADPSEARVNRVWCSGEHLRVGSCALDGVTVRELALVGEGAETATALLTGPLDLGRLGGTPVAVSLTVDGQDPAVMLRLPGGLGTVPGVAAALQAAIRAAGDAPPARRVVVLPNAGRLVILPGVVGSRLDFAAAAEVDGLAALGLGTEARFVDGVASGAIEPFAAYSAPAPCLTFLPGFDASVEVHLPPPPGMALPPDQWRAQLVAGIAGTLPGRVVGAALGNRLVFLPVPASERGYEFLSLTLDDVPSLGLDRRTAALLGNVVAASHGETVSADVIGDGDASRPFQRFRVGKKPVTRVSGRAGVQSTLRVMVDGVAWTEVPTLYDQGPQDQVYVVERADDGTETVIGGDGTSGRRVPTGRANVVARYRLGGGLSGRAPAGAISVLLDRPAGLKGVSNPLATDGGADAETLAEARRAAPGSVRVFGRAVSLRDFEDLLLSAGEVAKARATWVWSGTRRSIHITVAGPGGGQFSEAGLARLRGSLDTARDPNYRIILGNYVPVPVVLRASIGADPARDPETVLSAARRAALEALAFERVPLGRPLNLSDLYRVLQLAEGVAWVDIDQLAYKRPEELDPLRRSGEPLPSRLLFYPALPVGGTPPTVSGAEQAVLEVPEDDLRLVVTAEEAG